MEDDYYFLGALVGLDSARVTLSRAAGPMLEVWRNGAMLESPPALPVRYRISPGGGALPAYIDETVPVMSNDLIQVLHAAGVDNLQLFEAVIEDPASGRVHGGYKAVNILGLLSCADRDATEPVPRIDPARARDLALFRLAEQPALLVVHRRIKRQLEAAPVGQRLAFRAATSTGRPTTTRP